MSDPQLRRPIPLTQPPNNLLDSAHRSHHARTLHAWQAMPSMLEIVPDRVDKWTGMQQLLAHLGLPRSSLMAVGDGLNDLTLVANAGAWAGGLARCGAGERPGAGARAGGARAGGVAGGMAHRVPLCAFSPSNSCGWERGERDKLARTPRSPTHLSAPLHASSKGCALLCPTCAQGWVLLWAMLWRR